MVEASLDLSSLLQHSKNLLLKQQSVPIKDNGEHYVGYDRTLEQLHDYSQQLLQKTFKTSFNHGSLTKEDEKIRDLIMGLSEKKVFMEQYVLSPVDIEGYLDQQLHNSLQSLIQKNRKKTQTFIRKSIEKKQRDFLKKSIEKVTEEWSHPFDRLSTKTLTMEIYYLLNYAKQVQNYNEARIHFKQPPILQYFKETKGMGSEMRQCFSLLIYLLGEKKQVVNETPVRLYPRVQQVQTLKEGSLRQVLTSGGNDSFWQSYVEGGIRWLNQYFQSYLEKEVKTVNKQQDKLHYWLQYTLLPLLGPGQLPFWPTLFYLLRLGAYSESLAYVSKHAFFHNGSFVKYFSLWIKSDRQLTQAVRSEIYKIFLAEQENITDPYCYLIWKLMSGLVEDSLLPQRLIEKLPGIRIGWEDALWLHLMLLTKDFTLNDCYEKYFKHQTAYWQTKDDPLVYTKILLLMGQFQEALKYLYAQGNRYTVDAVHISLCLVYYGLSFDSVGRMLKQYLESVLASYSEFSFHYWCFLSLVPGYQQQGWLWVIEEILKSGQLEVFYTGDGQGLLDQYGSLFGLNSPQEISEQILLPAASKAENDFLTGSSSDNNLAILLYHQANRPDKVLSLVAVKMNNQLTGRHSGLLQLSDLLLQQRDKKKWDLIKDWAAQDQQLIQECIELGTDVFQYYQAKHKDHDLGQLLKICQFWDLFDSLLLKYTTGALYASDLNHLFSLMDAFQILPSHNTPMTPAYAQKFKSFSDLLKGQLPYLLLGFEISFLLAYYYYIKESVESVHLVCEKSRVMIKLVVQLGRWMFFQREFLEKLAAMDSVMLLE